LFFGFIRDYKGLDLLLKAMSDSRIKVLNIKLLVAGEFYTDAEYYHKLIAELNLESSLILATDFIPDSKVGLYFSACDMVVQPYKTATQSGVTQIAYHFEKPMLVTRVGGLPEIVPHGQVGYVVDIDPLKIADAIVDFYQNDRKEAFIENCKIEKKKYSWEQMLATIESLNANQ
jgi:glycosyltransferase involved in cell wall biosynthesis